MADVEEGALLGLIIACAMKKKESIGANLYLLRRGISGSFSQIFEELHIENQDDFQHYIRMPFENFLPILQYISPKIEKTETNMRDAISLCARLEATLLYLSTGMSYTRMQYYTRISKQSLSIIISETCRAIYECLKEHLKVGNIAIVIYHIAVDILMHV